MNNQSPKNTLPLSAYQMVTSLLAPLLPFWLNKRVKQSKEDPQRLSERHGQSSYDRPSGKVIWMHAASVGESQMMMPIVNRLLDEHPGHHIVFTTGTCTAADLMVQRLPANALHQYAPADYRKAVIKFLNHWKPNLILFAESEIWPNMILESKKRGIPLALLNARMSQKSIASWGKKPKSAQQIFQSFDKIIAADTPTANGLTWLAGKPHQEIECAGNLKDAAPALPFDTTQLKQFKKAVRGRKIWCAASTHEGEEDAIIKAHIDIRKTHKNALLILVPRHPERTAKIETIIAKNGLDHICYDGKEDFETNPFKISAKTHIVIINAIGLMGLVYRLAPISFIGGSLRPSLSGHNPLEPARLGSAIIAGQYISSFADAYMALLTYNGAKRILHENELSQTVTHLLSHEDERQKLALAAQNYAQGRDAVLDYVWAELTPLLEKSGIYRART